MTLQDSFVAVDGAAVLWRIGVLGGLAVTRAVETASCFSLTPGCLSSDGLQCYTFKGTESSRSTLSRVCQEIWQDGGGQSNAGLLPLSRTHVARLAETGERWQCIVAGSRLAGWLAGLTAGWLAC